MPVAAAAAMLALAIPASASAAPSARPGRAQCIAAAETVNVSLAHARQEQRAARRIAALALVPGYKVLAANAQLAADGAAPLIRDLAHRLAVASEAIDDGQYRKCAVDLAPWMKR